VSGFGGRAGEVDMGGRETEVSISSFATSQPCFERKKVCTRGNVSASVSVESVPVALPVRRVDDVNNTPLFAV